MQRAILAKRTDAPPVDTDELHGLATAAGYDPVETVTQVRPPDSTYQFGRGRAEDLADRVPERDADVVVFGNDLSPTQTAELESLCPPETDVVGRFRLVLNVFECGAGTREAKRQVELARLKHELPRVRERIRTEAREGHERRGRHGLGEMEDKQVTDIERRIDRLRTELDGLADETAVRRARRREAGFDHVALAGYTNAGKSTLFQRLADDVDLGENETRHDDLPGTAEAADRLFETLGTTTRRATMDGRPVLVTDTVGFVSDLPHELVEAFESTLSAVWEADVVVNVVDVSDPPVRLRETVETSRDLLSDRVEGTVVTVCNKADAVDEESLADRRSLVAERVDDEPVVASAADGSTTSLRERIVDALPTERATVCVPNASAGMSVVSWAYDHATVEDVRYEGATCELTVAGRPSVVARVRSRATAARESVGFDGDPESVESDGRDTT